MVNDALSMVKSDLTAYTTAISECANPSLRSTIQEIRNNCETSQYELFKLAQSKGFYQPASQATSDEIQQVWSQFQQSGGQQGQQGQQSGSQSQQGSSHNPPNVH